MSVNFIFSVDIFCSSHSYIYFIFLLDICCVVFLFFFFFFFLNSFICTRFTFLLTFLFNNLNAFFFEEKFSLVWLKVRNKIFVLHLRKVSLIKYFRYKNIQKECQEPFYKKVSCLLFLKTTCYSYLATL